MVITSHGGRHKTRLLAICLFDLAHTDTFHTHSGAPALTPRHWDTNFALFALRFEVGIGIRIGIGIKINNAGDEGGGKDNYWGDNRGNETTSERTSRAVYQTICYRVFCSTFCWFTAANRETITTEQKIYIIILWKVSSHEMCFYFLCDS